MKRSELTAKKMADMGWVATFEEGYDLPLKDIVFNIQSKNDDGSWFWQLRCVKSNNTFTKTDFRMCSTYKVAYKIESLEVSTDGKKWYEVARRNVKVGEKCVYAD